MTIDLALIFPLESFAVANLIIPFTDYHTRVIGQIFIEHKDFLSVILEKIACSNNGESQRAFFDIWMLAP